MIRSLLLCGGLGTRFGGDKLLAPVGGVPLAVAAARSLLAGTGNALAIVREGDEALAAVLRAAGCDVLATGDCARGMGASLAAGVRATRDADGWLVALGDMPRIRPATHAVVREAVARGALLAAAVETATGRRGHPVAFSSALGDLLASLDGDEGARGIVALHRAALVAVPVDDPGILLDVDTTADLPGVGEMRAHAGTTR